MRSTKLSSLTLVAALAAPLSFGCGQDPAGGGNNTVGTGGTSGTGGRRGTGGSNSSGGTSGSGGSSSSGGTSGSSGGTSGSGGSSSSGGATASGGTSGGTGGAGETEAGTPETGGDMASVPVCSASAVAAVSASGLIDDFEDGDNVVLNRDGRMGDWWLSLSDTAVVAGVPMKGGPIKPAATGGMPGKAMRVKGTEPGMANAWGGQLAARLAPMGACYDVSVFKGIKFSIKGTAGSKVYVQVLTESVAKLAAESWAHYRKSIDVTGAFQEVTVAFDALEMYPTGSPPPFDPKTVFGVGFSTIIEPGKPDFDFTIDNPQFYK